VSAARVAYSHVSHYDYNNPPLNMNVRAVENHSSGSNSKEFMYMHCFFVMVCNSMVYWLLY
jgi:hypothetical protein